MAPMSDEDLIKQAYEEFIKNLFRNFYVIRGEVMLLAWEQAFS
jgi:hypothetical protein